MSEESNNERDFPFISEIPFGAFALCLTPFVVLLTLVGAVGVGLIHPTRWDELWARQIRQPLAALANGFDDSTVISLHRTMCFGECPAYSLRVYGSGTVEYEGHNYVCAYGAHRAAADSREVRRLVEAMIATGYFGYVWEPGMNATDNATVTTSLSHKGRSYQIEHYLGDRGAPGWLRAMEHEIDRVAGTQRWLPDDERWTCPTFDGGWRYPTMDEPDLSSAVR